jgi:hypothetical protein
MKNIFLAVICGWMFLNPVTSRAITFGPFGPHGEGGTQNGQTFTIGPGGSVFELDGFLSIGGLVLNSQYGVSAQLSRDALPAGLGYGFATNLSADLADLVLTYTFTNTASTAFSNVFFFVLLDAEIDEATNTFFDEYGIVNGAPGLQGYDASQWQIGEPGFQTGTLLKHLYAGALDNSNSVPPTALNDVATALGFSLSTIQPGIAAAVEIMISEQGHTLSSFSLSHHDIDPASSNTVITVSGVLAATPSEMLNPGQPLLVLTGQVFEDASTNGPANPGSSGLSGVPVLLLSNSVPVRTNLTDSTGRYAFSVPPGLTPGTFGVEASAATGLTFLPVLPAQHDHFALSNPASVVLPLVVPVLNFDFRGAAVPQTEFGDASGILHWGISGWSLNYATGNLVGTLSLTNPANAVANLGPPWKLGLKPSADFFYVQPAGTLPDGVTNIDVSPAVSAQVAGGLVSRSQVVVLTNAVEIYSRFRSVPSNGLFEIWATQQ